MNSETDGETISPEHLASEATDIGNKTYLDIRLEELKERYSEERLSRLSTRRLRGDKGEEGETEEDELYKAFQRLESQFPSRKYKGSGPLQKIQKGDNYRGLSPLTIEQEDRIEAAKIECVRNLDRAMQDAKEREHEPGRVSRFGTWLNEFVDNLTPLFSIKW